MDNKITKLKSGDIVEVLNPLEILKTLDSNGTLDNLPFMPEMVSRCGKRYKVKIKIEKTCVEFCNIQKMIGDEIRKFTPNNVVYLEDMRCNGKFHDNCQVSCHIFWKEAWLKKVDSLEGNVEIKENDKIQLMEKLKTRIGKNRYFCQSTQLYAATNHITVTKRFIKFLKEVLSREVKVGKAVKSFIYPAVKKIKRSYSEALVRGSQGKTPTKELNLAPGEMVQVKTYTEILYTLDKHGRNRGLEFNHRMQGYCGKIFKVRSRLDHMINESTGEMRNIKNTVILENVTCVYENRGFGCPRERAHYWREIWLERVTPAHQKSKDSKVNQIAG